MKKLFSLIVVLITFVSYGQKLKYISFSAPEGARVYISDGKPYYIEDSLMSFDDITYLGTSKGITSFSKKNFLKIPIKNI